MGKPDVCGSTILSDEFNVHCCCLTNIAIKHKKHNTNTMSTADADPPNKKEPLHCQGATMWAKGASACNGADLHCQFGLLAKRTHLPGIVSVPHSALGEMTKRGNSIACHCVH